jgi:hypothetical protein
MTETSEGGSHEQDQDAPRDERRGATHAGGRADDPAHHTAPPGNPETDPEAVEKGEETLGRVVGH